MKEAMKRYDVNVIGYTWGGFQGTYTYKMAFAPTTAAEVKSVAGDFQSIDDFQVVFITTVTRTTKNGNSTRIDREVIRDWNNYVSAEIFYEAQG